VKWASGAAGAADLRRAATDAVAQVRANLDGAEADLVVPFVSEAHSASYPELPALLAQAFPRALVVGCSARSVIGGGHELEDQPALSLSAAALPGVKLHPFAIDPATLPNKRMGADLFGVPPQEDAHFLVFADPFTVQTEGLLHCLDAAYPHGAKVGGLASGGE
jgi:small ligand-binding sensory domain FIST